MPIPTEIYNRGVKYSDLQFKRVPITMLSSGGTKYESWVDTGMPKIPEKVLDCVFYLYKNKKDAENGKKTGGTGFLVGVTSERFPNYEQYNYIYGVSNLHVIKENPVVRLNTLDGKTEIFEFKSNEWDCFPEESRDDIAISPQISIDRKVHKICYLHTSFLMTDDFFAHYPIGIGEDVFMVGRFMDHDGGIVNHPSVRFGHIAMMPTKITQTGTGYECGKSYVIDLHSRKGFSGSPVFVYRTPGGNLEETNLTGKPFSPILFFFRLLGVHWGQFPETWGSQVGPIDGLSGMTMVVPAQRILDLLMMENIRGKRKEGDKELEEHFQENGFPPLLESEPTISSSNQENQQHKEDFNSLLSEAAKKKKQDD